MRANGGITRNMGLARWNSGRKGSTSVMRLIHSGYFQNSRRHGEGLFTYPNGDTYSGNWKWGKKHGKGTYIYKDTGMKIEGQWDLGSCLKGRWVLPNGVFYEGSFANNKPNGQGQWVFLDGNICPGTYTQKEKEEDDADDDDEDKKKEDEPKPVDEDEEDKEPEEEDEPVDGEPEEKKKFKLIWSSSGSLLHSASKVKEIQALE